MHAIDTVEGRTFCIDLDFVPLPRLGAIRLQMSEDGEAVEVIDPRDGVLGTIDVGSAEAEPADGEEDAGDSAAAGGGDDDGGGGGAGAVAIGAGALALVLGAAVLVIRRRPRRAPQPNA